MCKKRTTRQAKQVHSNGCRVFIGDEMADSAIQESLIDLCINLNAPIDEDLQVDMANYLLENKQMEKTDVRAISYIASIMSNSLILDEDMSEIIEMAKEFYFVNKAKRAS